MMLSKNIKMTDKIVVLISHLLVEIRGFEPLTYTLRTYRATNCAISPKRGERKVRFLWWEQMGSNHRPLACQASALTN